MKRALIIGVGGQDGSYMADLLVEKGYHVSGIARPSSVNNLWRIDHLSDRGDPKVRLYCADLLDPISIREVLYHVAPDEVYNLADQDNVNHSFEVPGYNARVTYGAVADLLEAIRPLRKVKLFQPVSATIFGGASPPQNEDTLINPMSPYAVAKAATYHLCRFYRKVHDVFVSTGIMFQHSSPRQLERYLLPKIVSHSLEVRNGFRECLSLGNFNQVVDIGFAGDYMEAAWSSLQRNQPDDYVIASGGSRKIIEIVHQVFSLLGMEVGIGTNLQSGMEGVNQARARVPSTLVGCSLKAHTLLNWYPKTNFDSLLSLMMQGRS